MALPSFCLLFFFFLIQVVPKVSQLQLQGHAIVVVKFKHTNLL